MNKYFVQYYANRDEWSVRPRRTEYDLFPGHKHPFSTLGIYYFTVMAENQVDALVKAEIEFTLDRCGGRITKSPDELWRKGLGQL